MNKTNYLIAVTSFAAAALAVSIPATAAPIEVPNWNFELGVAMAEGQDVYITPSGQFWHLYNCFTNGGTGALWNPGVQNVNEGVRRWADVGFGGVAPDGDHVGIVMARWNDSIEPTATAEGAVGSYVRDSEAICQVLETVLFDPNETYTLTVDVGHPPGNNPADGGGTKVYE